MGRTATELMKELKNIEFKKQQVYRDDLQSSRIVVNAQYIPMFESNYNYSKNREVIKELNKQEIELKHKLNEFNNRTLVIGYDLTINDALVTLGQLKSELKVLTTLANKKEFEAETNYRLQYDTLYKVCYDLTKVAEDAANISNQISKLQIALDRTNLTVFVD